MKKIFVSLVTTSVLFLAATAPAFAAENIFQRFTNAVQNQFQRFYLLLPGDKPADAVLNQAVQAGATTKSFVFTEVITANVLRDDDNQLANAKLTLTGPWSADLALNPDNYKQAFNMVAEIGMQGTTLRLDSDVKIANKTVYFKLNQMPALGFADFSNIEGKWLKSSVNPENKPQQLSTDQQQALQTKMRDAYQQLLHQSQLGSAKKETKNGKDVFVVDATVPHDALIAFFQQLTQAMPSPTGQKLDAAHFSDVMKTMMSRMSDVKVTLWIDRSNYHLIHFELPLTYTFPPSDLPATAPANQNMQFQQMLAAFRSVKKLQLSIVGDFDKFNEPVEFETPSDAEDAPTAWKNLMTPATSNTGAMPGQPLTPTELPALTPKQKQLLERYQQMRGNAAVPTSNSFPLLKP